jgi:hypothetical protein
VRVWVFPADRYGCGHYRIRQPAGALRALGHDVRVCEDDEGLVKLRRRGGTVVGVEPLDCDVAVFQRPATHDFQQAIPLIQRQGVAVVVEIDDLVTGVPRFNGSHDGWDPIKSPDANWAYFVRCANLADLLTVSTPLLAREYGGSTPSVVLPNCVPRAWIERPAPDPGRPLALGWTGVLSHRSGDLKELRGVLRGVLEGHGARLRLVGDVRAPRLLGLEDLADAQGWTTIGHGYEGAVQSFSVGLAPLADNKFNKAKSWLKPLEYAALGVPWAGSDVPEYRRLRASGVLSRTAPDWRRSLDRLLSSPALREELAGSGREAAAAWTVEARAEDWWEAWSRAAERRRARLSA